MSIAPLTAQSDVLRHSIQNRQTPQGVSALKPAFGMGQAVAQNIQAMMAPINNSRLLELFISDFLGMTFPRTYIETKMRGFETGRETLLRELVGGLTPVYVCGWAGALTILGLEKMPFNPKKVSFRAWIDANMMEQLGDSTLKVLEKAKSPFDLKRLLASDIISRVRTTDRIAGISDYKAYFPNGNSLNAEMVDTLSRRMARFKLPDYRPGRFLSAEHKLLQREFVTELVDKAVKEGGISSRVVLMAGKKPNLHVGARSLNDVLAKTSTFLDEFLGRAMPGLTPNSAFTPTIRRDIHRRLFASPPSGSLVSSLLGKCLPSASEGLIPYMYKLKGSLVAIPLLSTALFACSFAQINNWLTERRFGGRKFFPGEGIPSDVADKVERSAFEAESKRTKEEEQH